MPKQGATHPWNRRRRHERDPKEAAAFRSARIENGQAKITAPELGKGKTLADVHRDRGFLK